MNESKKQEQWKQLVNKVLKSEKQEEWNNYLHDLLNEKDVNNYAFNLITFVKETLQDLENK